MLKCIFDYTSEIHADTITFSCDQLPESLSRFAKINKDSIHPNVKLYKLITVVEYLFNKHCRSSNSFDLILDDLISSETKFSFQCKSCGDLSIYNSILSSNTDETIRKTGNG